MKVKVSTTEEVTDQERKQIAAELDGEGAKKRDATREEMQTFIWQHGRDWRKMLYNGPDDGLATDDVRIGSMNITHEDPAEDLIGGDDSLEDLI